MVMGGIVPVVNLEGIKPGEIVLDGTTLADIYLGKITKWNDPAIAALNPASSCPTGDRRRPPFGRLGHDLQLHQLSRRRQPGLEAKGRRGRRRSNGRSASAPRATRASPATSRRPSGSIGYVEYAYALQNKLTYTDMMNKAGKMVAPDRRGLPGRRRQRRLDERSRASASILTDQPGDKTWPITAATFILITSSRRIRRRPPRP